MKVNLVAQLFNSSVADALQYCEEELRYPQFSGCATVEFLCTVNAAFDVLNSCKLFGKGFKVPIKQRPCQRYFGKKLVISSRAQI